MTLNERFSANGLNVRKLDNWVIEVYFDDSTYFACNFSNPDDVELFGKILEEEEILSNSDKLIEAIHDDNWKDVYPCERLISIDTMSEVTVLGSIDDYLIKARRFVSEIEEIKNSTRRV